MPSSMLRRILQAFLRPIVYIPVATGSSFAVYQLYKSPSLPAPYGTSQSRRPPPPWNPPTRMQMIQYLKSTALGNGNEFDLLIVGGGATGAGVAVDAASRGLKVALVERDDFSAGTSSKSTKLVHGGVRYLQKAVIELDYEQYKLVREALHERKIFLHTAPYLSSMLPIMLPIYKFWQVPYYWTGCKMYDVLAGGENMESSYLMSRGKALEAFPMLKSEGLVGAVVYYDGQHNDSRMNVALIMTAVQQGAVVANHVSVIELLKSSVDGKLHGARVRDSLTGQEWNIHAKGIINATGPFTDELLVLDNPEHKAIVQPSAGVHITLPNYYSPRKMGLLDPATSDGRVIFLLPWQGNTIAGTTDAAATVSREPRAQEEDVRWLLEEIRRYLSPDIKVRRGDVLAAWSGLRPLVSRPDAGATEGLVRNHIIYCSPSGLLTIAGGKWTTYRAMAEEAVDRAVEAFALGEHLKNGCVTRTLRLIGSEGWSKNMFIGLIQRYGVDTDVAKHLADNYGDRAWTVLDYAMPTGESWPLHGVRLARSYPFLDAEVRYAVHHEYAQTAVDFVARRCRLAFLNAQAALDALPRVVDIMAHELGWSSSRRAEELGSATNFLASMGLRETPVTVQRSWTAWLENKLWGAPLRVHAGLSRAQFDASELDALRVAFRAVADDGRLKREKVREVLEAMPPYSELDVLDYSTTGAELRDVSFDEFLEICAGIKERSVAQWTKTETTRGPIPVEKSGGGV